MAPANKLFQPPQFFLTTLDRLAETSIIAMQRGGFVWHEGDNYSINRELRKNHYPDICQISFQEQLCSKLILRVVQTKKSLSRLKALPQWRKVKGIDETH